MIYTKTVLFLLVFVTVQFATGQSRAEKLDSISQIIAGKNPNVGISIGFIDNDKPHFFNYGKIARTSKDDVDRNSIFEIGSVTKVITANLMAQAHQEGKISIDDFIDKYLPDAFQLPEQLQARIQISDLASHQSGLPDFHFKRILELNPDQPLEINENSIHAIINDSTELKDYGSYRYSNINYVLMGLILENIYESDFENLIKQKILIPAQMGSTVIRANTGKNKVTGYNSKGTEQVYLKWNTFSGPAALLKSNTNDMVNLLQELISGDSRISNATKITERSFFKNTEREVGFGQEIAREGDDVFFYKTGDTFSCSSLLAYSKESDWGIIILLNQKNSDLVRELINANYEQVLAE